MNVEAWQAAIALAAAGALAWMVCRWWYLRRLQQMSRQMLKLDTTHQTTLRMAAQARKQIDELQRLTAEYRRRLTAVEVSRRPRAQPAPAEPVAAAAPTAAAPLAVPSGGWADTQPM